MSLDLGTFGSPKKFKTVPFLIDALEKMDRNKRTYIFSFIQSLQLRINTNKKSVTTKKFQLYTLKLMRESYLGSIDTHEFQNKFYPLFYTHFRNYVVTLFKISVEEIQNTKLLS